MVGNAHFTSTMKDMDFGKKPLDTKIQLTKSDYFLEVYIPPLRFDPTLFFMAPFTILWYGAVSLASTIWYAILSPQEMQRMLLTLPFWAVGGFLTYFCLFSLFGKTYLRIDINEISLIQTLFGQKVSGKRPQAKCEIDKLIFIREYSDRDSNGDRFHPAVLKIEIGTKFLQLGGDRGGIEHELELEWLAFEVSEWLDKPLRIIKAPVIG
jgi:hypothetical protein